MKKDLREEHPADMVKSHTKEKGYKEPKMLEGRMIDLSVLERSQLPILHEWFNDVDFVGEFEPFDQDSLAGLEKWFDGITGSQNYFIQKKDGTPIGTISYFKSKDCTGIGYMLVPEERGKGYGSEAVQMIVDYLFLHKDIVRIQAETHPDNLGSQRVLEKVGFTREGIIRRSFFSRGVYRDTAMWSILRDEWKEPKILPIGYRKP
jgi:RimJ/RimL family protein N-acetyltransferase